jgi:hypothetical protein
VPERLGKRHARGLKFQIELFDVLGGGNRDRLRADAPYSSVARMPKAGRAGKAPLRTL